MGQIIFNNSAEELGKTFGHPRNLPNFGNIEQGINMNGNVLLLHMNGSNAPSIIDTSGQGNNGTSVGGLTCGVEGVIDEACQFDGNSSYINMGIN